MNNVPPDQQPSPTTDGVDDRGITSVNPSSRRGKGNAAGQGAPNKAALTAIAVAGLAAIIAVGYFKLKSAARPGPVVAMTPGKQAATSGDELDNRSPTQMKLDQDKAIAEAIAERERRLHPPGPLVPTLPVNAPDAPVGARSADGSASKTPEAIAAEKAAKDAADLAARRRLSPLLAYTDRASAGTAASGAASVAPPTNGVAGGATPGFTPGVRGGDPNTNLSAMKDALIQQQKVLQSALDNAKGSGVSPTAYPVDGGASHASSTELGARLVPTKVTLVSAAELPNRDLLLTQGNFIDCTLETAVNSSVPGFTGCMTTRNVYSESGRVILLERGTRLIGEYQGGIKQGQARIFVLWSRAITPRGVTINLDSSGTGPLGEGGMSGDIDNHFWQRFGGTLVLSLIQDGFQALDAQASGGSSVVNNLGNTQAAGRDAASIALDNSINIPPTLYKNQGESINVTVARDLDFSSVYQLRLAGE